MRWKSFLIVTDRPFVVLNGFTGGQVFPQGRPVPVTLLCADEAGGSSFATASARPPTQEPATGTPGTFAYTVTATR